MDKAEKEKARKVLAEHLRADLDKGGHCESVWKTDSLEILRSKHSTDHIHWGRMLKHKHDPPRRLETG
jgi:hypothetical protein